MSENSNYLTPTEEGEVAAIAESVVYDIETFYYCYECMEPHSVFDSCPKQERYPRVKVIINE